MPLENLLLDAVSVLILLGCFLYAHRTTGRGAVPARARPSRERANHPFTLARDRRGRAP